MSPANFAQNPHHIIATAFPPLGSLEHDIQHTGQKNKKHSSYMHLILIPTVLLNNSCFWKESSLKAEVESKMHKKE